LNIYDLFKKPFQTTLNNANNAHEDAINMINDAITANPNLTLTELKQLYSTFMQPYADTLGVSFMAQVFIFPTLVRKQ
jgi:hypothetical protein